MDHHDIINIIEEQKENMTDITYKNIIEDISKHYKNNSYHKLIIKCYGVELVNIMEDGEKFAIGMKEVLKDVKTINFSCYCEKCDICKMEKNKFFYCDISKMPKLALKLYQEFEEELTEFMYFDNCQHIDYISLNTRYMCMKI